MFFRKKHKIIIDTDPGVDDTLSIILAMHDPNLDIKLFSICPGNISSEIGTRNMCHLLDIYHKDFPVVKGAKTAMKRVSEDAAFLHGKEGLGGYIPPKTTIHQPLNDDCSEAMYRVIKDNPHEITIVALGPHTNLGNLFVKHPDVIPLIKGVIYEGNAPFGLPGNPNYNSFNARTDPEAQKIVLDSGLPIVMVPSNIGRYVTHFTESQINEFLSINDTTRFLHKTCEIYWEPDAPDKRIATNDTCALLYLENPGMYKTKKAFVSIDTDKMPGKSFAHFDKKGNVDVVLDINRKKFFNIIYKKLHALDKVKLDSSIYDITIREEKRKAKLQEKKTTTKTITKKTTKK